MVQSLAFVKMMDEAITEQLRLKYSYCVIFSGILRMLGFQLLKDQGWELGVEFGQRN